MGVAEADIHRLLAEGGEQSITPDRRLRIIVQLRKPHRGAVSQRSAGGGMLRLIYRSAMTSEG